MNTEDLQSLQENLAALPDPSTLVMVADRLLSVQKFSIAGSTTPVIRLRKNASESEREALRALIALYRHWPAIKEALEAKAPAPAELH